MKVKRILLSVILAVIAIILVFNTETFAEAEKTLTLGAEKLREGKTTKGGEETTTTRYSYQLNTAGGNHGKTPVLKIVDKSNGSPDFSNAIYCLKAGQGFGSEEDTITDVTYTNYYDMLDDKSTIMNAEHLNLTEQNYNSILWLLDNIYLPKQLPVADRQKQRNDLLNKAFAEEFEEYEDYTVDDLYITDDDIEVVQQWALWYFTNENEENSNIFHVENLPVISVSEDPSGEHDALSGKGEMVGGDPTPEGSLRQEEAEILYNYLITKAKENNNYNKQRTVIQLDESLTQTVKQKNLGSKNYIIVGPFKIEKEGNTEYTFEGKIEDQSGNELDYIICNAEGNSNGINTLKDAAERNEEFYLKIEKQKLTSNKLEKIKLHISYTTNDTTATFWTVEGSKKDQPVVVVERNPQTLEDEVSVEIPEFDLALRKYITKVTRNGEVLSIDELTGRTPTIDKAPLNGTEKTTAEYKHRKDPVPVQTGDIVTFKLTIYNEGKVAGRATKIVDYLPAGLVFESESSENYDFSVSTDKRTITITPTSSYKHNLAAYNGSTLESETIEFTCKVEKTEEKGTGLDTILTNVAEITEAYDSNDVKMDLEGNDRDSLPNNLRKPSDAELPSYKGKSSNQSNLSDSTYHYEGQQDDDDFEKLKVTTPEFDLALRKFITHINGEKVTPSREPEVDTTALKDKSDTTATYTHSKDPLTVGIGSIIRYTIRVYNEGELDGYVTVLEDYLPEELELVPALESTINSQYGWSSTENGRVITTTYLNNVKINGYDGGDTLSYKDVEIECRVKNIAEDGKILTNIAQINGDSADDRDSDPQNAVKPTDPNLPDYNKHQEDDDDFEKVVIYKPGYDLALRKFITHIDGTEVTPSRAPEVDTTALKNKTSTTAKYTHSKEPLTVKIGSIIRYTIRVYNEGEADGHVTEIEDYLPEELELVPESESTINKTYGWTTADGRTVKTTYLNDEKIDAYKGGDTLSYKDVEIECRVKDIAEDGKILTNIAQIDGDDGDDRDSQPNNVEKPNDQDLPNYDKHHQDDDDFEKVIIHQPQYDLALRKFITHIDGTEVTPSRAPEVDTTPLKDKSDTTAKYTHSKEPLIVKVGSIIRYTIRVYNEGEVDGHVTEIEDYLPAELELVPESESTINKTYGWTTTDGRTVKTTYLNGETIDAYKGGDTLSYKDVEIECRVKDITENSKILTNIAQIDGDDGDDRDSQPNNVEKPNDQDLPNYDEHQQDDDDFEKVIVYKSEYDLALRKFITHIDGVEVTPSRAPQVDTTPLKDKSDTTALYNHPKDPLTVKIGSIIRYTIRVYNEGEVDGYATIIEDYLPAELELVPASESEINNEYGWTSTENGRIITTDYLADRKIDAYTDGDDLDYEDVQIECRVKQTENVGKTLTNIAQINDYSADDRDSDPQNAKKPTDPELPDYDVHQEDDDDFEKVIIYQPQYDLALRKFITEVNGKEQSPSRVPVVDVTPLTDDSEETTTATYTHPKTPVLVKNGDIVVYTIRIYNEGKVDAFAEEVKDDIPEGLEFVIDNPINIEYRWRLSDDAKQVTTDYLSSDRDEDNVIKAFDSTTMSTLDYKDVKIAFKVVEPNTSTRVLVNIAEIKDDNGKDIDSTPDNDDESEDDLDKEYVELRYFDLALRKFITKVESKSGDNLPVQTDTTTDVSREPKVEIDENGKIKYVHPKDPVIVANSDIVIYTLRVYNEGTIDGYAEEIKDDVPQGLELVPEHEINLKYGWVMYDEEGNVTDDPSKAKTIRTTYLSEANGEDNIINAFDRETMETPDYKDVQVAFRVVDKDIEKDRVVINTAEISKDSDDDVDSTPDNDEEEEDDLDKEYVKVQTFDLSLLKWVSKVMVTENGKTKVTETGYDGTEDPEPVVKVEVKAGQIKTVVIKYEYGIKITNEGEIAGYATEITDYIPEGLEFIPEDNPLWTLEEDGKIVTRQLENTLLQPGESAIVNVVFKWINNENNFGMKENIAEISEDYNDKDAPDEDSTPDNHIPEEDDQDNAFVVLIPKTGEAVAFIVLPTIILTVLATGIILIKKYVL